MVDNADSHCDYLDESIRYRPDETVSCSRTIHASFLAANSLLNVPRIVCACVKNMATTTTKASTDIFLAAENDDLAALKDFVEVKKIPIDSTTKGKRTVAHSAAKKNRLEIFKYIASADASLIKAEDMYGYTPLFVAVEHGALEIVQYLAEECKLSLSQRNKRLYGNTPLHVAAQQGQLPVLKYIVTKGDGVDVNAKNDLGEPVCFLAADGGHLEVIKFLAEETDADFSRTDSKKDTILTVCASKGQRKIAEYLLDVRKMKFDVNRRDGLGRSLVYLAAGAHHLDFLKYLVEHKGANVNIRDRLGRVPLHQAAMENDIHVVKYLLEKGADPNVVDHNGKLPSRSTKDRRLIKYLEKIEAGHRSRRSVDWGEVKQPAGLSMVYKDDPVDSNWLQTADGTNRLLESESQINHRERLPHERVGSSQVNGFLTLLDTCIKYARRSKRERAGGRSSSTPTDEHPLLDRA